MVYNFSEPKRVEGFTQSLDFISSPKIVCVLSYFQIITSKKLIQESELDIFTEKKKCQQLFW